MILDARRDPRTNDVRILVSVCRKQPLCVEGVDPEGAYEVEVEEAGRCKTSVCVRCAPSRRGLPRKTEAAVAPTDALIRRARRVLDLEVEGEENNFVERTIRIRKIAEPRASAVKAELAIAARPPSADA